MHTKTPNIASIISSRICHDLVSPLGAISNGLELMELSGTPRTQEFDLMSQSVNDANVRIQFFRYAFGEPGFGATVSGAELERILAITYENRRLNVEWAVKGDQPRPQVKLILLLIQCFESAMPLGGDLLVRKADNIWAISASNGEIRSDCEACQYLLGQRDCTEEGLKPSDIHFALAKSFMEEMQLSPTWTIQNDHAKVVVETKFE